jgi:hypothetical protein
MAIGPDVCRVGSNAAFDFENAKHDQPPVLLQNGQDGFSVGHSNRNSRCCLCGESHEQLEIRISGEAVKQDLQKRKTETKQTKQT